MKRAFRNKGFTLVELLAVIVILAIILAIAVPGITNIIESSRLSSFNASSKMLKEAAKTYASVNNVSVADGTTTEISYSEIKNAEYISEITDPISHNECVHSRVYVTNTGGTYTYKGALVCDNYMDIDSYNLIVNSDFSNGTTRWNAIYSSNSVASNVLSNTGNGTHYMPICEPLNLATVNILHRYYVRYIARITNSSCTGFLLGFDGSTAGTDKVVLLKSSPIVNTWYNLSVVDTPSADAVGSFRAYLRHIYADAATANGKVMQVDGTKGVYAFDLTAIYGSGNEPTASQIDNIMINMEK